MIQIVDKAYQITKHVSTFEDENQYILKDYISLRANIIIPNRNKTVIQVILRRSRTVNKVNRETNQKIWFYSVYEHRRGVWNSKSTNHSRWDNYRILFSSPKSVWKLVDLPWQRYIFYLIFYNKRTFLFHFLIRQSKNNLIWQRTNLCKS